MNKMTYKSKQLIEEMKKDRGYVYPEWDFVANMDPDFMKAYNDLYKVASKEGKALSAKAKEFIMIGILSYRGARDGVKTHILRAIRLGATKVEILEAIEATLIPGGASTFFCALNAMMKAFEEQDEKL